ncbi:MBL fold metallo-hydrolase [Microbacterium awajiense]|uniref:MBL fold metallo-hydrolase n=1 Tax=Microbacterium awajiense TaxID=415214 RepID=A0ABP7APQ5_9MICO
MLVEVASRVLVATSRIMSTTSTAILGDDRALLVDPAWMPDELGALATELRQRRLEVIGGFATHAHHDHLLWHPGFGDAPRWASDTTAALAVEEREALVDELGAEVPAELVDLTGRVAGCGDAIPDESLPAGVEATLIVHDGHAPGHTAVWLTDQRVLIAGDMLSDIELPLPFDPDDLPAYLSALDALAPFAAQASVVIPGHGTVGSDASSGSTVTGDTSTT